jgi:integrase
MKTTTGVKTRRGISAQTFNFYIQAAKQFCRWMVKDRRAVESPLAHLSGLNVKTDRRHDRRALLPEELRWLLEVTAAAPKRFEMDGIERAMLYRLAAETGLRPGELRSLTRTSFDLADSGPTIKVEAAYSKHRREDVLPLRPETAALLREFLSRKIPKARIFKVPPSYDTADMFYTDLEAAREAWIEDVKDRQVQVERRKSKFLAAVDDSGRYADFYCLRHSFISALANGGVAPKTAQTLARHSTITLTLDRYSHTYQGETSAALKVLPDLNQSAQKASQATGTSGEIGAPEPSKSLSPSLSLEGGIQANSVESGGVKSAQCDMQENPDFPAENAVFGPKKGKATRGTRTRDLRFTKPLLYQLS